MLQLVTVAILVKEYSPTINNDYYIKLSLGLERDSIGLTV